MGERYHKKLIDFLLWNERTAGDDLDWVAQGAAARGISVPSVVQKRPKLRPDAIFFWNAFLDLIDADWVACERYARVYNVDVQFLWKLLVALRSARVVEMKKNKHKPG